MSRPENNFSPPATRATKAKHQAATLDDERPHDVEGSQELAVNDNENPADGEHGDGADDQERDAPLGSGEAMYP